MKEQINRTRHAEELIKESNTPRLEKYSNIDIPTLKAINAMVYELGWYKNEPSK